MANRRYGTQRRTSVTVNVDWPGLGNIGRWDKRGGGAVGGDGQKINPAGLGEIAIGGIPSVEDFTVSRFLHIDRDPALRAALVAANQKADMSITEEILDNHENPTGRTATWTGVLDSVDFGEADSTSGETREVVLGLSADAQMVIS